MLIQIIEKETTTATQDVLDAGLWPGSSATTSHSGRWSELRAFSQANDQDFSGSGSAGIAAATGRVSMNDFLIEKSVDIMSERIFQWCCTGGGVHAAVIEVWDDVNATSGDPRLVIVLDGGVNFSHYKIDGSRYFGYSTTDYTSLTVPALNSGGTLSGTSSLAKDDGMTVTTKEFFKLWFTRMRIRINSATGATGRGWHAGENRPDQEAVPDAKLFNSVRYYKTNDDGWVK
ncbi:MAG: hypothetical protein Fues2KO_25290 [Fuerstiella sp.]